MNGYDHIYLSPHFDDAALSCGGVIHQQCRNDETVLVVTICAAPPAPGEPLSPFAHKMHEAMGKPADVVAMRRAEDRAAMEHLGVPFLWLGFQDAVYRREDGKEGWFYTSLSGIFGSIHPGEEALFEAIAAAVSEHASGTSQTTLYAPLTVGRHVDHQHTHRAAWALKTQGWHVVFYEDYPYADPTFRLPFYQENKATLEVTLASLAERRLAPCLFHLSEDDMQAKIDSVRAYHSQVPMLFGDEAFMVERLRAYARRVGGDGPAERFWIPGG